LFDLSKITGTGSGFSEDKHEVCNRRSCYLRLERVLWHAETNGSRFYHKNWSR